MADRDLFADPALASTSAPTLTGTQAPAPSQTQAPVSERQLMGAAGQSVPPASPSPTSPGPAAPAAGSTSSPGPTPNALSSGAASSAAPPVASAPGTTTTPVVDTPVLSQVQGNETVAGQLRELLSSGSPLLEASRNRATVAAASRGLQNSTLAAQAGEQAFLSAALPIAAADAATHAQRAEVNQGTQNQFGLARQDHLQRLIEQAAAGDINSRLQLEQAGYNSELSAQENLQRLEQLAAEGDIQASLALQNFNYQSMLAQQQQGYAIDLSNQAFQQNQSLLIQEYAQRQQLSQFEAGQEIDRLNRIHQNTLDEIAAQAANAGAADEAKWTRDVQQGYLNAVTQRQMAASQEIQAIYTTQGLSSHQQQQAVSVAQSRMRTDLDAIAAYFQQTPGWPTNSGGQPMPAPGLNANRPAPTPTYQPQNYPYYYQDNTSIF